MKRAKKPVDLSIIPVWEESHKVFAGDTLPVIWWNKPRGEANRKSRAVRNRDLTKVVDSVRQHIGTLEAKVTELKQLVLIAF
jgi:hypothetical protein